MNAEIKSTETESRDTMVVGRPIDAFHKGDKD